MFGEENSREKYYPVIAVLLLIVAAMTLFQVNDPYGLKMVVLLVCAVWSVPMSKQRETLIDVAILVWWGYDLLLCLIGINATASIYVFRNTTVCLLLYMTVRGAIAIPGFSRMFGKGMCLLVGTAVVLSLCSFVIFKEAVEVAGFKELYSFRFLFKPLGYHINAWATLLLLFAGLAATLRQKQVIGYWWFLILWGLIWCGLLLSFSRGAFLAAGFCGIGALWVMPSRREKIGNAMVLLLIGGMIAVCFRGEVQTTLDFHKTVSQRQSTQGRVDAIEAAIDVFPKHKWWGAGTGNYTLAIDKALNQDSTRAYTSYAPNILVQVFIERGWIGIVVCVFFGIGIAVGCLRNRKQGTGGITGMVMLAVLLKEMTLGTLLSTPFSLWLIVILLAWTQSQKSDVNMQWNAVYNRIQRGILMLCAFCYMGCVSHLIYHRYMEKRMCLAEESTRNGDYDNAIQWMVGLNHEAPLLINKALIYMQGFRESKNEDWRNEARRILTIATQKQPEDIHIDYLLAELAWLENDREKAFCVLNKLLLLYPNNALYSYKMYEWLQEDGKTVEALAFLEKAIRLMPRILLMESVQQKVLCDSVSCRQLTASLLEHTYLTDQDPGTWARYGFMAYYCGKKDMAKSTLSHAVKEMPNLSTPWLLLGQIYLQEGKKDEAELCFKKHYLLTFGAFTDKSSIRVNYKQGDVKENCLYNKYVMKFHEWYGYRLLFP